MTAVRVHIDRLVLDGWAGDARSAEAVRAAVAAELGRLVQAGGDWGGAGGAVPWADAGAVTWAGGDPGELGAAIGRAVYGGVG